MIYELIQRPSDFLAAKLPGKLLRVLPSSRCRVDPIAGRYLFVMIRACYPKLTSPPQAFVKGTYGSFVLECLYGLCRYLGRSFARLVACDTSLLSPSLYVCYYTVIVSSVIRYFLSGKGHLNRQVW